MLFHFPELKKRWNPRKVQSRYFICLDLTQGYLQIGGRKDDQDKTVSELQVAYRNSNAYLLVSSTLQQLLIGSWVIVLVTGFKRDS